MWSMLIFYMLKTLVAKMPLSDCTRIQYEVFYMTKELDPNLIEAARSFQLIAQAANVPTILVGAFARGIYLSQISSLKAYL